MICDEIYEIVLPMVCWDDDDESRCVTDDHFFTLKNEVYGYVKLVVYSQFDTAIVQAEEMDGSRTFIEDIDDEILCLIIDQIPDKEDGC